MQKLLLIQFDLHVRLYNNVLKDFSDEETNTRLYGNKNMNHVKYLAGHLLNSQYLLGIVAGVSNEVKWNDLFAVMGLSEAKDHFTYPDIIELKVEWNRISADIRAGLEKLSKEDLETKPPAPFDQVAQSIGELWAFVNHHIAYHIGQIAILRKGFGKSPMGYD